MVGIILKKWNRKLTVLLTAFILVIMMAVLIGVKVLGSNGQAPVIPSEVNIAGKVYTKDNPLKILEIVPNVCADEIGYMIGSDAGAVKWSDIVKLPEKTQKEKDAKKKVRDEWVATVNGLTGAQVLFKTASGNTYENNDYRLSNSDYNTAEVCIGYKNADTDWQYTAYDYRNIFAYSVFQSYDMTDKIDLVIKSADTVSKEEIADYGMVYVSAGGHLGDNTQRVYQFMVDASRSVNGLNTIYQDIGNISIVQSQNNYINNGIDMAADVVWEIFYQNAMKGKALIFDKNAMASGDVSSYNIGKLGTLIAGIDKDTFIKEYASGYDDTLGVYKGTMGSINPQSLEMKCSKTTDYYKNPRNPEKPLAWKGDMFVYSPYNNTNAYPYYSATNWNLFLNANTLLYNGDNTIGNQFINGSSRVTDWSTGKYVQGTSFEEADQLYGDGNGTVNNSQLVHFILQYVNNYTIPTVNVLEIQPSGACKYNTTEMKKTIGNYFGFNTTKISSIEDYITVTSVSSNAFNGMNEDLAEKYDLLIIGDYNPSGFLKNNIVYYAAGDTMKIDNINRQATLSSNDFTEKSLEKIITYAKTGQPMVLASSIYNGNTSVIDRNSAMVNLSLQNLQNKSGMDVSNILREPDAGSSYSKLLYRQRPVIQVSDSLKTIYNGDQSVASIAKPALSDLNFDGIIGDKSAKYSLQIIIDKNCDGLFSPESTDDTNEVFYNEEILTDETGKFNIQLQLPEETRGYVAWKAVVTDKTTGLSSEDTGAFIVEVTEKEKKTINVLQILPMEENSGKKITLNLSTNQKFKSLFAQTEDITGLTLNVTAMTTRQFENLYKNNYYQKDNYLKNNMLKEYSMVVIGFSDCFSYDDISNENGALDNLCDYIECGNSVLFAHDTLTYSSYSDDTTTNDIIGKYIGGNAYKSKGLSYNITSKLRELVGMDRYGISTVSQEEKSDDQYRQGYSNIFMLSHATVNKNPFSIFENIKAAKSTKYTNKVNKLNQGQITQYPYKIEDNLTIAQTHGQYFQLDLEQHKNVSDDAVVWYTLGQSHDSGYTDSEYFSDTGDDALNNYYIYSKGSVTYSGAGHSTMSEDGELKLFVNTIIKTIMSGNSMPVVTVDNAVRAEDGVYEMYIRNQSVDEINIDFTAIDADLNKTKGQFKSGCVFWDVDGDEVYTQGTDIILEAYDSNQILYNAKQVELNLGDYKNVTYFGTTLAQSFQNNELRLGFQATDARNCTGFATLSFTTRKLFNLN